jgi:acylglycerol lipase
MVPLGNSSIPIRQWTDKNIRPRAIVVALHGASRHSGTYQTLAEHLVSLGYLVVSPDLRGHGEWYFSKQATAKDKIANWDKSTDDVVALLDNLRQEYPRLPIFCMGESTGAAVAIKAAARCPAVNGLVLSAIGTRPCVHDVPNIVCDAFEGIFDLDKPLDVKDTIIKYSSDDERVRLNAGNDPLVKPMSARELLRTSLLLNHTVANAEKLPSQMPVLMLQGDKDEIVTVSSARSVLRHISSHEKEMLEFPYGHILLTTPFIHSDVMSKVSDWLGSKTAEQQTVLAGATHVDNFH